MALTNRRDVLRSGGVGSSGGGAATRRLCVVSRNPLQSGVFIAGLTTSVGSQAELEIIVDRRRDSGPSEPPSIERRHRPSIVRALERDGFAIVPAPSARPAETLDASLAHAEISSPPHHAASEETYDHRLERLLRFKHRRLVRLSRWFIFSVVMNAILFLMLVTPVIRSVVRPGAPASSLDAPAPRVTDSLPSRAAPR